MGKRRWWVPVLTAIAVTGTLSIPQTAVGSDSTSAADPADPADEAITDPIPEKPIQSRLGLVLEEYAQLPESEATPPATDPRLIRHNRINFIGEVPDGSGREYIPDLNGPLYLLDGEDQHVFLDFAAEFEHFFSGRGMGSGFGFVTFHPEFAENGVFYTTHTENETAIENEEPTYPNQPDSVVQSVITEWTADDPSADVFSGSSREIFRYGFSTYIHAIQQIDFNPTARPGDEDYGLLYLAVGDGGIGVRSDAPQDLSNPAGKILRIDPAGTDGPQGGYGIPPSNPFVDTPDALGEIYALGMRDPHRFTWDPEGDNAMYLGHIGQHAVEAVYEVEAGDNLGWSEREGDLQYRREDQCYLYPLPEDDAEFDYVYPVAAYDHDPPANWPCDSDSGHAISGGQVYRGELPELRGKYVFGDLVDGKVFYTEVEEMRRGQARAPLHELQLFDTEGTRLRMSDFVGEGRVDLRFGIDSDRELYLLAKSNGKIWRVVGTERGAGSEVTRKVERDLVAHYDFENPFAVDGSYEADLGSSNTLLSLVNGETDMRVADGAFPGSNNALQLGQIAPEENGNDDWKAGIFDDEGGVESFEAFNGAEGTTVMGWFKMTGQNPSPNSNTPDPDDYYNAVGLAGILSGSSDGHEVRALLELIEVDGELRLVALGRRIDGAASQTFAAHQDWQELLPQDEWVHLAATFDYTTGEMALYRNGEPIPGFYTRSDDPWEIDGSGTSETNPRGIKIGGSFPQNDREANPCNCRMDSLMFLDTAAAPSTISQQYHRFLRR